MRLFFSFFLFFAWVTPAGAQDNEVRTARQYIQLAVKAYRDKDYQSSASSFAKAIELRPDHPTLIYNLAAVSALLDKPDDALRLLRQVSSMGLIYQPERDSDFASVWGRPEFKSIVATFESNSHPVGFPTVFFTFDTGDRITEGIAFDPVSKTTYIGSVRNREILAITPQGTLQRFSHSSDSLWGVFGMRVDAQHRFLWVCTSAIEQMEGFTERDKFSAAVCKYDLRTGALVKRYVHGDRSRPHIFGDLVVGPQGDVYISDSMSPLLFVVREARDSLEVFLESPSFVSLQGLDFSPDGTKLFVADYSRGLFMIDRKTRSAQLLHPLEGATLLSIDALGRYKNGFIAVQNDINPKRVVMLTMNSDWTSVKALETVVANHSSYDDPSLGIVVGNEFFYNANGQWDAFDEKGNPVPAKQRQPHVIVKTKLP